MNDLTAQARRMVPSLSALSSMPKGLSREQAFVYLLRLKSGAVYTGATLDILQRLAAHENGNACRTTKIDPPTEVLFLDRQADFSAARKREAQVKRWSRAKKEALAAGDRAS